jgi:hypothetical protein
MRVCDSSGRQIGFFRKVVAEDNKYPTVELVIDDGNVALSIMNEIMRPVIEGGHAKATAYLQIEPERKMEVPQ